MKLTKKAGATSEIWQIFIQDTSKFDGSGLTGLTNASSGLTAYYHRDTDTTATVISLVSMTVGTFTSSGFKEIDSANMPGWYQFCPPNAALASGAKTCAILLKGAANMAAVAIEVQLAAVDPDSASAFLTGVNSLAPPTNWNAMAIDSSGRVDLGKWIGNAPNALQSGRVDSYLGAVAAGVIAAASFAANALDAVWSTTTRLLTAGTNIVLAKGTGITGFNDLSAAQVNAEADTALADVGLTGTVTGRIDAAVSSRSSHSAADVAAQITTDHGSGSYLRNTEPSTAAAIASQVRTELATELAHLDADVSSRSTYAGADTSGTTTLLARLTSTRASLLDNLANLDAAISAITFTLSSAERNAIADAYLDRANGIEAGLTPRQADRLIVAAILAKASGMDANAPVFRDFNDTKDRLTASTDEFGNRLSVTYDPN